jgi:hypothetical protein
MTGKLPPGQPPGSSDAMCALSAMTADEDEEELFQVGEGEAEISKNKNAIAKGEKGKAKTMKTCYCCMEERMPHEFSPKFKECTAVCKNAVDLAFKQAKSDPDKNNVKHFNDLRKHNPEAFGKLIRRFMRDCPSRGARKARTIFNFTKYYEELVSKQGVEKYRDHEYVGKSTWIERTMEKKRVSYVAARFLFLAIGPQPPRPQAPACQTRGR